MRSRSLPPRALAAQRHQGPRDADLVAPVQAVHAQNEPVKWSGAGSRPRRSTEMRPPGSRK